MESVLDPNEDPSDHRQVWEATIPHSFSPDLSPPP